MDPIMAGAAAAATPGAAALAPRAADRGGGSGGGGEPATIGASGGANGAAIGGTPRDPAGGPADGGTVRGPAQVSGGLAPAEAGRRGGVGARGGAPDFSALLAALDQAAADGIATPEPAPRPAPAEAGAGAGMGSGTPPKAAAPAVAGEHPPAAAPGTGLLAGPAVLLAAAQAEAAPAAPDQPLAAVDTPQPRDEAGSVDTAPDRPVEVRPPAGAEAAAMPAGGIAPAIVAAALPQPPGQPQAPAAASDDPGVAGAAPAREAAAKPVRHAPATSGGIAPHPAERAAAPALGAPSPAEAAVRQPALSAAPAAASSTPNGAASAAAPLPGGPDAHARAAPGHLAPDLAVAIRHGVAGGREEVHVRLDPPELGRIHVRLGFETGGALRAVVTSDNGGALSLLRRDVDMLDRALADAGVRTDAQSFRFDQGGFQQDAQQQQQHRPAPPRHASPAFTPDLGTDAPAYRPLRGGARLNMTA